MPYHEVDRLLVEGEFIEGPDGTTTRVWPSQREVAKRFGVAPSLVAMFASQHGCSRRKVEFQAKKAAEQAGTVIPEPSAPLATPTATEEPVAVAASAAAASFEPEPIAPTPEPNGTAAASVPTATMKSLEPVSAPARTPPPARTVAPPPPAPPLDPKRKPGRPRKAEAPLISYEELDRLLVFGEVQQLEDGSSTTVYPSHRQLAERYKVVPSVIASYAKSHNCMRRREEAKTRIAIRTEEKLIEARATAMAVTKDDAVRMIDSYLVKFEQALEEGRVRFDNPTDFNTMLRLKEFVLGGADSRQEIHAALSLESLQQRHARMLREAREATPELAGVIDAREVSSDEETEQAKPNTSPSALFSMPCSVSEEVDPPPSPTEDASQKPGGGEGLLSLAPAVRPRDGAHVGPRRAEVEEGGP